MIIRLIAVDPRPRPDAKTDLVVYQVPENSREMQLLTECFEQCGVEWQMLVIPRKPKEIKS